VVQDGASDTPTIGLLSFALLGHADNKPEDAEAFERSMHEACPRNEPHRLLSPIGQAGPGSTGDRSHLSQSWHHGNHSGEAERSYGIGLKLFGFIPEPVFAFIPHPVRDHPGTRFGIIPKSRSS
jgi:hypothetical protein